jgi:hypothetical protein
MSFRVARAEIDAEGEPQDDEAGNRGSASTHVPSVTVSSLLKGVKTWLEAAAVR